MKNRYADFDRSEYPLITVSFTGEKATDDNFQVYLDESLKNYERGAHIMILFDATIASFPAAKYQKMQAQWMKQHNDLISQQCLGIAYTIPNAVIRQALKLIFKLQKQPVPFKIFASNKDAKTWLSSLS
jgi:hypothetical protein